MLSNALATCSFLVRWLFARCRSVTTNYELKQFQFVPIIDRRAAPTLHGGLIIRSFSSLSSHVDCDHKTASELRARNTPPTKRSET